MIRLGDKVKDSITGLTGIAVARSTYLNGCDHIAIQGMAKDGKVPDMVWFDEPQIVLVKAKVKVVRRNKNIGGPKPAPVLRR